ncbi:MAG: GNAT family N-acetyltransferase [Planctomycetes bacterium]|nr:GNAT family N-acetyltransferase [Planctomycetota bacterium]
MQNKNRRIRIRKAKEADFAALWDIFHAVVKRGDTFSFDPQSDKEVFRSLWMAPHINTYVALMGNTIRGTYIMKQNQPGLGGHVANCAYMVDPGARSQGIGKSMGKHSIAEAKKLGFLAIQFNFVVSTNITAIHLWLKLGFKIVGTVPAAFKHSEYGFVDIYIMHRYV